VAGGNERDVIPNSIKLIAGRTGQEFNQRKNRKGAYWEDRYHATAVESGDHLFRCLVYIDLNMVRAGVVNHPSDWAFGGYNEIQNPKRKKSLINYQKLTSLLGFASYDDVIKNHKRWVDDYLGNGKNIHDEKWTKSIAVGEKSFVERMKALMGVLAAGRKSIEVGDSYQLRESAAVYNANFKGEKDDIGLENACLWDV
jgi:hypothetical protein